MAIQTEFDPSLDGWFFENWGEATDFDWSLYRRTYVAINPSDDPSASPEDSAFFQIFKSCASKGNCGGMSLLAVALFRYGGYMGYGSPANFYTGVKSPDRADLHQAINIMQARQFSMAGIRNFLDVSKANQLNDGVAAFKRIQSGLASGDYCLLSLSNGVFGDAAHTIIPYRAWESGGTQSLLVWNSNRPFDAYPTHYNGVNNRIDINPSSNSWRYDQGFGGTVYDSSNNGWFFAIPTSLIIHKGRHPMSLGFGLTALTTLFVRGTGAAVTQIEDDEGNRLYTNDTRHAGYRDREMDPMRRVDGVAPWPWAGGLPGEPPGELFFIERPAGSAPLSISIEGDDYQLFHMGEDHLTRLRVASVGEMAKDTVRLSTSVDGEQTVDVETQTTQREVGMQHLRADRPGTWKGIRLNDTIDAGDRLQMRAPVSLETVDLTTAGRARDINVEFLRHDGEHIERKQSTTQEIPTGATLRLVPTDWERLNRARVAEGVIEQVALRDRKRNDNPGHDLAR